LHTVLPLETTPGTGWAFAVADYDLDGAPDLVVLKLQNGGTVSTEVHILSGARGYQSWLLHTGTPLEPTDTTN
jgi:hypothetical protein